MRKRDGYNIQLLFLDPFLLPRHVLGITDDQTAQQNQTTQQNDTLKYVIPGVVVVVIAVVILVTIKIRNRKTKK